MKYEIGVCFGVALQLSDAARRRILEGLIRTREAVEAVAEPEHEPARALVMKR